ncbi:SH3 domain-containing protein [Streptomyces sp. CRN 30]|uniref:SH3 domain-containing protein n=1 Tax=Streptomyces sp. CRN 30 TaxID=3075613 RepID=UPI002A82E207|nr:SH3 domain-containing protein [Streptomyces sp. CRN 30]
MRSSPALRALTAALFTGGVLTAGVTGAAAGDGPVPGTVTSPTALAVREAPTSHSAAVDRLAPGTRDRVVCAVQGQSVEGNPYWYWLEGTGGWATAAYIDTHGQWVRDCPGH